MSMNLSKVAVACLLLSAGAAANAASSFFITIPLASSASMVDKGAIAVQLESDFGLVLVGDTARRQVHITNTGESVQQALTVQMLTKNSIIALTHDCAAELAPGASCTAYLAISPSVSGNHEALIRVSATPSGVKTLGVKAQARLPMNIVGGSDHDYGLVVVGEASNKSWSLRNTGEIAAPLPSAVDGLVVSGTCGAELAAGASCLYSLQWAPQASEDLSKTLRFGNSDIAVSGYSRTKSNVAIAGAVNFDSILTTEVAERTVTLTNSGQLPAPLSVENLPAGVQKSGTCTSELPGNASCTYVFKWVPTQAQTLNSVVAVTAGHQNLSVAMQGSAIVGFRFTQTLSGTVTNYNLNAAATASGWNGAVPLMATVDIAAAAKVGATATSTPAFIVYGLPQGSKVSITNRGSILGQGGNGGSADVNGNAGGHAIIVDAPVTINNYGLIAGGGGGGAGGRTRGGTNVLAGGGGGGGGQGYTTSSGGAEAYTFAGAWYPSGTAGGSGSQAGPGGGGGGSSSGYYPRQWQTPWYAYGDGGGAGGSYGAPGASTSELAGGAAGAAIIYGASGSVTWGNLGTVYGAR